MGILGDPVRRALYLHVARAPDVVSREDAAVAVGISRSLAAFHLDRLVDEGLLEAEYRRLTGRSGPGAGRPAKVYRQGRAIAISMPERDYEFAARLLIEAVLRVGRPDPVGLSETAHEQGRAIGEDARRRMRGRKSQRALTAAAVALLEEQGFHPSSNPDGTVRLRNCPFDALADEYPGTMCQLNLPLVRGMLEGFGIAHLTATPRPRNGGCCVAIGGSGSAW